MASSPAVPSLWICLHPATWLVSGFSLHWPLITNHPEFHPFWTCLCSLQPGFLVGLWLLEKIKLLNPDIFSHFVAQRIENQAVRREFTWCKSFSSLAKGSPLLQGWLPNLVQGTVLCFQLPQVLSYFLSFSVLILFFPLAFTISFFFLHLHFIFIHCHNLSSYTFLRLSALDDIAPKSYFARPCFSSLLQTLQEDELTSTWNYMVEEKPISSLDWYLSPSSFLLFSWSSLSYVLSW